MDLADIKDPEIARQVEELENARTNNAEKIERISQLPVAPFSMLPDRIDSILEFLCPTTIDGQPNPERLAFEKRWEMACGKFLDAVIEKGEETANRQKLLVAQARPPAGMGRPPLVIPGQP